MLKLQFVLINNYLFLKTSSLQCKILVCLPFQSVFLHTFQCHWFLSQPHCICPNLCEKWKQKHFDWKRQNLSNANTWHALQGFWDTFLCQYSWLHFNLKHILWHKLPVWECQKFLYWLMFSDILDIFFMIFL